MLVALTLLGLLCPSLSYLKDILKWVILGLYWDHVGIMLRLYSDHGKENGSYYSILGL